MSQADAEIVKRLSIVVPVYFNAESLPALITRMVALERELLSKNMTLEIIFVDDGSGDTSLDELLKIKQARPDTKVIKLTRNFGAFKAVKCGFGLVTGDCFMTLVADLQDPPELIIQMVESWRAGSKFTICERSSREDPIISKILSSFYYWLLRRLVVRDYPAGGYDMALMDRSLLQYFLRSSKNMYAPMLGFWLGYRPTVIRYHRARRQHGKSRWTFWKKFNAFLDIMLGYSATPIRLMSGVGLLVATLSFSYGIFVTIKALVGKIPVMGFASIAALLAFLLGLVIIMLGTIGEYLWRVSDEVNGRQEAIIDEIFD
jgi:dolichol-phosphate mannosyltransferase